MIQQKNVQKIRIRIAKSKKHKWPKNILKKTYTVDRNEENEN